MTIYKEITGEGEDVVVIHDWGCDYRHMKPNVRLHVISGAQHMLFWTHPDLFKETFRSVLEL